MIKYMYWIPADEFGAVSPALRAMGVRLAGSKMTPCETLKMTANNAVYATPQVFSRMCVRQGSWYRDSARNGKFLLLTPVKLPAEFEAHLDAKITDSDFVPDRMPTAEELQAIVDAPEYQDTKPEDWEKKTRMDAIMVKILFTVNRAWGWGDTLARHWLGHRANHANFLSKHFTTKIDGEDVAYSVTENAGVCSSCVEFFNITNTDQRKLVRACPGAITFGGAPKKSFLDVQPIRA